MIDGTEARLFRRLVERLDEDIRTYHESFVSEPEADFAKYRERVGLVRGLILAKERIIEIEKTMSHALEEPKRTMAPERKSYES